MIVSLNSHWPHILRSHPSSNKSIPSLQTRWHRETSKDPAVAKAVDKAFKSGDLTLADTLLQRHLSCLTEYFLAPLNRYFSTLPPSTSIRHSLASASLASPTPAAAFNVSAFLSSLTKHGTSLQFRNANGVERFYKQFLNGPNFVSWIEARSSARGAVARKEYLRRLQASDLGIWIKGRADADVDELVGRMEDEAVSCGLASFLRRDAIAHRIYRGGRMIEDF